LFFANSDEGKPSFDGRKAYPFNRINLFCAQLSIARSDSETKTVKITQFADSGHFVAHVANGLFLAIDSVQEDGTQNEPYDSAI
jgi:hypothetical protein